MGFPAKPEKQEKRRSATVTEDLSSFEIPFTCQNGFLSTSLKSSCTLTQSIQFWTFDNENHAQLNKRIGTSERKPELWLCIKWYGRSMEQEMASQRDKVLPRRNTLCLPQFIPLHNRRQHSFHSVPSLPRPLQDSGHCSSVKIIKAHWSAASWNISRPLQQL